jgi:hypothetical protein
MRLTILVFAFIAGLTTLGCVQQQSDISECDGFEIRGLSKLLDELPLQSLTHRKQTDFDPLKETSEISFADASYEYDQMLTYTLSFPKGPRNQFGPNNGCISSVSFFTRPAETKNVPSDALFEFLSFLRKTGLPDEIYNSVRLAYTDATDLSLLGRALNSDVWAGALNHFRGSFFVVTVRSLDPFEKRTDQEI